MSPARSTDPLRKVTLNLFESDVEDLAHYYGHGWSEVVRDLVHKHIIKKRNPLMRLDEDGTITQVEEDLG